MTRPKGLTVRADADVPQLLIYDAIGPAWAGMVDAKSVLDGLAELGSAKEINLRINSGGGDVFEAVAIYNALTRHPARIVVDIDALAASAAAYVAMAGDRLRIAKNAMLMVHRCWCLTVGNSEELLKTVELLEKIDQQQVDTYVARSKLSKEEVTALVEAETWMTADEAVGKGLADEIGQELQVGASIPGNLVKAYKNTPKQFLRPDAPPSPRIAAAARHNADTRRRLGIQ